MCVYLILGGVETWYATGFGHMGPLIRQIGNGQFSGCLGIPTCEIIFVVKGWAVAAVSSKSSPHLYESMKSTICFWLLFFNHRI